MTIRALHRLVCPAVRLTGLRLEPLHRRGGLRHPRQVDELGAVAELVRPLVGLGERDHVVVAEVAGIFPAAEQLTEGRDRRREARLACCGAFRVGRRDRRLDQLALILARQLVADAQEGVFLARIAIGRSPLRVW